MLLGKLELHRRRCYSGEDIVVASMSAKSQVQLPHPVEVACS